MTAHLKKGTPEWQARHEGRLAIMREKFRRDPLRSRATVIKRPITVETVISRHPSRVLSPQELAHAIRIAAKMASEGREPNPLFIEALEIAATYFDEVSKAEKHLT